MRARSVIGKINRVFFIAAVRFPQVNESNLVLSLTLKRRLLFFFYLGLPKLNWVGLGGTQRRTHPQKTEKIVTTIITTKDDSKLLSPIY